jgi:hypothetical protein
MCKSWKVKIQGNSQVQVKVCSADPMELSFVNDHIGPLGFPCQTRANSFTHQVKINKALMPSQFPWCSFRPAHRQVYLHIKSGQAAKDALSETFGRSTGLDFSQTLLSFRQCVPFRLLEQFAKGPVVLRF